MAFGTQLVFACEPRRFIQDMVTPRQAHKTPGGFLYPVLNRTVARLFQKDADDDAFLAVFVEALEKHSVRVLAFCRLPNHWHVVLWPRRDSESADPS